MHNIAERIGILIPLRRITAKLLNYFVTIRVIIARVQFLFYARLNAPRLLINEAVGILAQGSGARGATLRNTLSKRLKLVASACQV